MNDEIGPALPPGFGKQTSTESSDSEHDVIGAALPDKGKNVESGSDDDDDYGPALLPTLNKPRIMGPSLPPGFNSTAANQADSSDDDCVGPSLDMAAPANAQYDAAEEFAARNQSWEAERKRIEDEKMQDANAREEWMMSLPTLGLAQDIGLTARNFRNKAAPQQDGSWTKVPGDQGTVDEEEPRPSNKRRYEETSKGKRDEEIAAKLENYNDSNRQKSLVEMHEKKLKKEKKSSKEKGEGTERVPFSRERDMQVNKFDDAQRKSILKKAALLDTRFGHGSQKYE